MNYTFHPIADLFPLMEGEAFKSLVADIKAKGLKDEIEVIEGNIIIDGRNRYRACKAAGVTPCFKLWPGKEEDIPGHLASKNLERRHLTPEERAFIAARLANMKRGDAGKGRPAGKGLDPPTGGSKKPLVTEAVAASTMQVSSRAVERAKSVIRHAPDLEPKVVRRDISLSAAADEARLKIRQREGASDLAPAEGNRRPRMPKFPELGPPSNGLQFARMAIMDLEKIHADDTERKAAFHLVGEWIDEHKEG